ncbi:hypothetical protein RFI_38511, partial [Reticulomyxa filosa]
MKTHPQRRGGSTNKRKDDLALHLGYTMRHLFNEELFVGIINCSGITTIKDLLRLVETEEYCSYKKWNSLIHHFNESLKQYWQQWHAYYHNTNKSDSAAHPHKHAKRKPNDDPHKHKLKKRTGVAAKKKKKKKKKASNANAKTIRIGKSHIMKMMMMMTTTTTTMMMMMMMTTT